MARKRLNDRVIEELLAEDDVSESDCSENEDELEVNEDNSDSCQSGDDDDPEPPLLSRSASTNVNLWERSDLSDVPLIYIRQGHYMGKDKVTRWNIQEPSAAVRTRPHNIKKKSYESSFVTRLFRR